ncbi:MAG: exo-alpha-sialidase [Candidatus Hydrogenedentes bacterium]|nr:exo-alpha-sialidase [Candidatus Hydrogenedentota bacterium]
MKRILLFSTLMACAFASAQSEPIKNVVVFKETNKFAGWPANNGMWSWGNEMVVGFVVGAFDDDKVGGHPIKAPQTQRQARSLDGGETWAVERPSFLDENEKEADPVALKDKMDFTDPNFAFKFRSQDPAFYYSTDRCKTWNGPYTFPNFDRPGVLARTDYIVNGKHDMFAFLTSPKDDGKEGWPYCARTLDGGLTWELQGWIGKQPPVNSYGYAIMPSTVRLKSGAILSIIRHGGQFDGKKSWWIDAYLSPDEGKSWYLLDGPKIDNAGNPASMIRLADGRIALTYGWRHAPYGLRARISDDEGQTWGNEIVLRHDGARWDLGYPRSVQRPDGKVVTCIYFNDATAKERYIAATIWNPSATSEE